MPKNTNHSKSMKYIFGKIKSVKKIYSECKEILQLRLPRPTVKTGVGDYFFFALSRHKKDYGIWNLMCIFLYICKNFNYGHS